MKTRFSSQRGAVLFMALIFLVLLTVMAVTTFTISKGSSQVIGNMTSRKQTLQTAAQVSDMAISTYHLVDTPNTPILYNGSLTAAVDLDVNGDTKTIINTVVPASGRPNCFQATLKQNINLDLNDPVQKGCANSNITGQNCYDISFRYTVEATDAVTGAVGSVTQGASVIAQPGPARNICHGPAPDYVLYF